MKTSHLLIDLVVLLVVGLLATSSYAKIDPESCIGMWLFDEGAGDAAKDSSGNGNDGKLMNGPKWVRASSAKLWSLTAQTVMFKYLILIV